MAKQPNQQVLTKKHIARLERERTQQRYLIIGAIIVVVLVLGVVLFGVLDNTVLKAIQPVAKVGNESITTSTFQKEVRFQRYRLIDQLRQMVSDQFMLQFYGQYVSQIQAQLEPPTTMGKQVVDMLVEEAVVKDEAKKRNITVSDAEVDKAFQEAFGYFPNGTSTPTVTPTIVNTATLSAQQMTLLPPTSTPGPTSTPAETSTPTAAVTATATQGPTTAPTSALTATATTEPTVTPTSTPYTKEGFDKSVSTYVTNLKPIGYNEADLRTLIRRQLLRQKVYDAITKEVPTTADQVWARHILVKTEEEAKAVIERLNKGEKFDDVAKEVSTDTGSKAQGGDLGWFSRGKMVAAFEDVAFKLKIGEISQPVKSDFGYHVIQVLGHEVRPLDPQGVEQAKQEAYNAWLEVAKKALNAQTFESTWQAAVPSDPAIPADVQGILDQLNAQQQQQQQQIPSDLLQPTTEPAGPQP